ncbi:hypothetical protein QJS10_CPA16g00092 [Acorus calamus]|uniref:Heparan-alpha-glucosaminide N-acetyltransferase catalytic domain-containing protein n=1 Tax=Acorus calamus TaxID=4465 RepID=A0AAV9CZD2_ACOCL|nr:hypothetical protein QJS10_CPA16g00092 [Acorus calamus]
MVGEGQGTALPNTTQGHHNAIKIIDDASTDGGKMHNYSDEAGQHEQAIEQTRRRKKSCCIRCLQGPYNSDDAGGAYERIDHSPWNGCTLADVVMPFFLFIVGVAVALALKRIPNLSAAIRKIVIRTLKLLFWGLLLQGGYSHAPDDLSYGVDMNHIRWCGILQVKCGMRGHLGPACNAVGYVNRQVWGVNHLYSQPVWIRHKVDCTKDSPRMGPLRDDAPTWCLAPFEPEGLLSSISAILSGTIGIHYGHILIHFQGHWSRLKHWVLMGLALLIVAIILHFTNDFVPHKLLCESPKP